MKKTGLLLLLSLSVFSFANAQTKKTSKTTPKKTPIHRQTVVTKTNNGAVTKNQRVEITTNYGTMVVRLYDETPLHRDNFIKLVTQGFYDSLLFHRVIKSFMIQGGDPLSKHADPNVQLGSGDIGYKIPAEFNKNLFHKKGVLAAARDNNPAQMSSGCQFYIVQGKKYTTSELEQIINNKRFMQQQEILTSIYQADTTQAALSALQNLGDQERIRKYMEEISVIAKNIYKAKYPDAENINMDQVQTYVDFGGTPHLDGAYTVFGELESGYDVLDKIAAAETRPGDRPAEDIWMKMRLLK